MDKVRFQIEADDGSIILSQEKLGKMFKDISDRIEKEILPKIKEDVQLSKTYKKIQWAYSNLSKYFSEDLSAGDVFLISATYKYLFELLLVSIDVYKDKTVKKNKIEKILKYNVNKREEYLSTLKRLEAFDSTSIQDAEEKTFIEKALKPTCKSFYGNEIKKETIDNDNLYLFNYKEITKKLFSSPDLGGLVYDFVYKTINLYAHPSASFDANESYNDFIEYLFNVTITITHLYDKFNNYVTNQCEELC